MSQIEVNTNFNSVNVENVINTIDVNQDISNILVIPQEITNVVEIVTPGPKGDKGESGDPSLFTSSFVGTASFNAFTQSYYEDSASFSASISQLQDFSSSLDATFATDAELNAATASLSASITILSSSFLSFSSSYNTGSFIGSFDGLFTGSFTGDGSGIVGVISSSYAGAATSASFAANALTASYFVTESVTSASYALTASYAVSASNAINSETSSFQTNIQFLENYVPLFNSNNSISSSTIHQSGSNSIIINREFNTANAPEALFVFQPDPNSFNIITAEGNVNNYVQINIKNENSGSTSSADVVATADNGDEFVNFINMGINSSTFTGSIGGPNDAYLYSTGNDLTIGNATANKHVRFFTGGGLVDVYQKLVLNPDDLHELTGSLFVHNGFIYSNITGSLEGTASFAASASYAATSSYASNFTVANTLTATTLVVQTVSSSVVYSSGSNIFGNDLSNTQEFTGSVTITGSLFVNNSAAILTNQTSSMSVLSASYALTSSYALNAELLDGLDSAAFTLTSSFNNFTSSYNTGSFTGSFIGDGSGLLGVISASYSLTASFIDGGIY
jgi:hypothetical protein